MKNSDKGAFAMNEKQKLALDYKIYSNKMLYIMSIVLLVSYILQTVGQMLGGSALIYVLCLAMAVVIAGYVLSFRGFTLLKKANALEDTAYPNTGRNFNILSIVFCVLSVIFSVVMVFVLASSSVLQNQLQTSPNDASVMNALKNVQIIYGIIYGLVTVLSLQTITGLYMMRTYNIEKSQNKTDNFALFCAIFTLTAVIVNVLSILYNATYKDTSAALTNFSVILRIASYVVSIVFFNLRGKKLDPDYKGRKSETEKAE